MLFRTEFGLEKRNYVLPLAAIGLGISAASALGSLAQGAYNSYQNKKTNERNNELATQTNLLNMQNAQWNREVAEETNRINRENLEWNKQISQRDFDYNKQLQQTIFQREDSAVQRMVADNRLAGLSPIAGLSGASAGQALEANTPSVGALNAEQLNQNMTAPQMSANQLLVDFSSMASLGNQIQQYELNKDNLKIKQQQLELEKSSNEANLKDMEQKIKGTELDNQLKAATLDSKIEGAKLGNQKVEKEIARASAQIIRENIGAELDELEKIQTKREMEEWLENKGLRADLGDKSLERIKEEVAMKQLTRKIMEGRSETELQVLKEQVEALKMKNLSEREWRDALKSLGLDTGTGSLAGKILKGLIDLL